MTVPVCVGATVHKGGTYICMEGPAFSTEAESNVYRQLGFDVIGMTAAPEQSSLGRQRFVTASLHVQPITTVGIPIMMLSQRN